jgi:putative spermidine/putrescine transport system permease protein
VSTANGETGLKRAAAGQAVGRVTTTGRKQFWTSATIPLLLVYLLVFIVPQVMFLRNAFYQSTGPGTVGGTPSLDTLRETLSKPFTLRALITTLELSATTAIMSVVVGLALAYTAVHSERWGGLVFAVAATIMFTSAVARVLGWQVVLSDVGPINMLLSNLGVIDTPIKLSNNFFAVCVGSIHSTLPVAVIGLMPACGSLPKDSWAAAKGLGASNLRAFGSVFLPHCRPALFSVGLLVFATIAGSFTTPALLGGGHVPILSLLVYADMQQALDYSGAAATGAILLVVVGIVVLAALLGEEVWNRRRRDESDGCDTGT